MPELPDIEVYVECLRRRVVGQVLRGVTVRGVALLRTFDPPVESLEGGTVCGVERMGKRIVLAFEHGPLVTLHLMIAGRLLWKAPDVKPTGKIDQAAFAFDGGTLVLTEASPQKRAALHVLPDRAALVAMDPGGLEPMACSIEQFTAALVRENRTLKRALTDPRVLSGVGNAYSDEVLFAARMSPIALTRSLEDGDFERLLMALRETIAWWTAGLRWEFELDQPGPGRFPGVGEITAFRPEFMVHGKFGQPCRICRTKIQRIVRAENEVNYCPGCQTGGRVLADRSLSRLLKQDWPTRAEDWG